MYASDGRTLSVAKSEVTLYGSVGWYEHIYDIHTPTADAAESVIKYLLKQGYQLVTASELLDAPNGGAEVGKAYGNGY